MKVECYWTDNINDKIYKESLEIRKKVFIGELGSEPEVEICDEDKCIFLLIYVDESPAATGRIELCGKVAKLQRIAVEKDFRGSGLGYLLIKTLERKALEKRCELIEICASMRAYDFYRKLGYKEVGEKFLRCGIEHIIMRKEFTL